MLHAVTCASLSPSLPCTEQQQAPFGGAVARPRKRLPPGREFGANNPIQGPNNAVQDQQPGSYPDHTQVAYGPQGEITHEPAGSDLKMLWSVITQWNGCMGKCWDYGRWWQESSRSFSVSEQLLL